jgi:cytochrome c biogenesis protein CcmG/thiol:disulfide interchange protein DsbE
MRRALSPVPVAVICVLLGLVALLAYGLASNEPDRSVDEALQRGERDPAPELELPRLAGGGTAALADYRGQVVVLNFWASWCKPCKEESPLLERWHRRMRDRGGTVLGVDMLDVTGDAQDFIDEYGLTYPMLKDGDGEGLERFGVVQYPETFVIDRQGRIAALRRGPVDEDFMRSAVAPLLEPS